MAYKSIPGTRVGTDTVKTTARMPCPRCGYQRNTDGGKGNNRTGLCKDCSSLLTPEERQAWRS